MCNILLEQNERKSLHFGLKSDLKFPIDQLLRFAVILITFFVSIIFYGADYYVMRRNSLLRIKDIKEEKVRLYASYRDQFMNLTQSGGK